MKSITIFTISAAAAALLQACGARQTQESLTQVKALELKDTACVIDYAFPATIKGLRDVAIYPQVSGRITAVKVVEGQYVNKGDVLFEIDDVPFKAQYEAALAQVEVSKSKLETARLTQESKENLFNRGIISEYQLKLARNETSTAKAELGQSQAALTIATNNLSFTKVRTMGKGFIGALPFKVGSLVGPSMTQPLTVVSDNESIYADFSIPENTQLQLGLTPELSKEYKESLPVKLLTNIGKEYSHTGRIHSISGLISAETGSIPVRAIFPNPEKTLLSGGSCKVILSESFENVIAIPRSAIKEIQNKYFVFAVKDSVLSQIEVNVSRIDSKSWGLLPGADGKYPLKAGDRISATTNRLMDGEKVEIIK